MTASPELLDRIAAENDAEVTIFIGDTRRATTITNASGDRITGTSLAGTISSKVLNSGEDYTDTQVDINGSNYSMDIIHLSKTMPEQSLVSCSQEDQVNL